MCRILIFFIFLYLTASGFEKKTYLPLSHLWGNDDTKRFPFFVLVQAKSDDELAREKAWLDSARVWLQHGDGFTAARLLPQHRQTGLAEGQVRVQLQHDDSELIVDEEDVVKANPSQFDLAEDLAQLRHLNEASVLNTLRCRYAASLPHTYAGPSLVIINPVSPLAVYSERVNKINKIFPFCLCD